MGQLCSSAAGRGGAGAARVPRVPSSFDDAARSVWPRPDLLGGATRSRLSGGRDLVVVGPPLGVSGLRALDPALWRPHRRQPRTRTTSGPRRPGAAGWGSTAPRDRSSTRWRWPAAGYPLRFGAAGRQCASACAPRWQPVRRSVSGRAGGRARSGPPRGPGSWPPGSRRPAARPRRRPAVRPEWPRRGSFPGLGAGRSGDARTRGRVPGTGLARRRGDPGSATTAPGQLSRAGQGVADRGIARSAIDATHRVPGRDGRRSAAGRGSRARRWGLLGYEGREVQPAEIGAERAGGGVSGARLDPDQGLSTSRWPGPGEASRRPAPADRAARRRGQGRLPVVSASTPGSRGRLAGQLGRGPASHRLVSGTRPPGRRRPAEPASGKHLRGRVEPLSVGRGSARRVTRRVRAASARAAVAPAVRGLRHRPDEPVAQAAPSPQGAVRQPDRRGGPGQRLARRPGGPFACGG